MKTTKNSGAGFCVPRVKPANSRTTGGGDPITLLDRFREAVLRLIMISAVSKSTTTSRRRNKQSPAKARCHQKYHNSTDPYPSEAVADCIEFIRTKKAIDLDNGR